MEKVFIEKAEAGKLEKLQFTDWPIWTKEVSTFEWFYEQTEECYILEGKVIVHESEKQHIIEAGDFVRFEKGLSCKWEVVHPIKKHYSFK